MKNALLSILFLSLSVIAGEPYSFRITSTSELANSTVSRHGLCVPIKVDGKKLLLTAMHVVTVDIKGELDPDEVLVDFEKGWIRCKIVKKDPRLDLCLLEPAIEPPFTISISDKDAKGDDKVINPNYYAQKRMVVREGKVDGEVGPLKMATIEDFSHGSSGSPVLNSSKKLVGLSISGLSKDNGATIFRAIFVPVGLIKGFLKKD